MGNSVTLAISIITGFLSVVRAGSDAWKAISEARDTMNKAQAEDRDLTDEEFTKLMALNYAPGDELQEIAEHADETLIAELPGKTDG